MLRTERATALFVGLLALGAVALSACGSSDGTASSPTDDLRARAAAGLNQSYTAVYEVTGASGTATNTLTVRRTPTSLRLDVKTAAGVSSSITTASGTVACQQPAKGTKPTCLTVAAAGATPPAAFDPALRTVFGADLTVLADATNGLTVTQPSVTAAATAPAGLGTPACFTVSGGASAVAAGTYCLSDTGVPTSVTFPSGTATLVSFTAGVPAATAFVPAVSPTPLPSATTT